MMKKHIVKQKEDIQEYWYNMVCKNTLFLHATKSKFVFHGAFIKN